MAMVDAEAMAVLSSFSATIGSPTDRADSVLPGEHFGILSFRHVIRSLQMASPVRKSSFIWMVLSPCVNPRLVTLFACVSPPELSMTVRLEKLKFLRSPALYAAAFRQLGRCDLHSAQEIGGGIGGLDTHVTRAF